MGRKRTPGLYKRGDTWHIDKRVFGSRLCESCNTSDLEEAERFLARQIEELRQTVVYGVRPKRFFREAATKYLAENQHKASLKTDAYRLRVLDSYLGDMRLDAIHMGTLQEFIVARREEGVKTRTINNALKLVRHLLNLASGEWIDEHGLTWLAGPPKIKLFPEVDARKPYPLSWEEQAQLFRELPPHLERMALFAVNTGCRDAEICALRWEWEMKVPELNTSVFIIPGERVKNREDRLVVLNEVASSVVEAVRGQHPVHVFVYREKPITRMLNSAWLKARKRADLTVRVHDLKHTFGRRLRAAGVSFEDRQDLLGHKSGKITTHYSASEVRNLLEAANSVVKLRDSTPTLTLLRRAS
jgi:integrase